MIMTIKKENTKGLDGKIIIQPTGNTWSEHPNWKNHHVSTAISFTQSKRR
jgi:3-phenylpropionate/cinnamic acid dioxygenase small subunit